MKEKPDTWACSCGLENTGIDCTLCGSEEEEEDEDE